MERGKKENKTQPCFFQKVWVGGKIRKETMILVSLWRIYESAIKTSHLPSIIKSCHNASFIPKGHMLHLSLEHELYELSRVELQSLQHIPWFTQQWRRLLFVSKANCSLAAFMLLLHFLSALHTNNCLGALHKNTMNTDQDQNKIYVSICWCIFSLSLLIG